MTYDEAKKQIRKLKSLSKPTAEAVDISIEALEKQIAKNAYDDAQKLCVCPNCKRLLEGYEYFCWNCGQRIDWSEE